MHTLLISGSTRAASTNTAMLRTVAALAPPDLTTELHTALAALPAFNPDDDHDPLPEPVARLRDKIHDADALLFCTPEYAGRAARGVQEPARLGRRGRRPALDPARSPSAGSTSPGRPPRAAAPTRTPPSSRSWATSAPASSTPHACGSR